MPSSGTAVLTVTRDQLITEAYKKIRVLPEGGTANAAQIADAASRLNLILTHLQSKGLPLWTYQLIAVPCVANQSSYTIGPSGADVTTNRPLRVVETGNFVRFTVGSQTFDTPLRLISRAEYLQFGNKTSTGIVNSIYYDSKIDAAAGLTSPGSGWGTLYVYVTPQSPQTPQYTVYINAQRPLYVMTASGQEFDLPTEWFMYLMYALAAEMADDNEVPEARIARLEKKADEYRESLFDWSVETASTSFAPDYATMPVGMVR
jgi:hypothetical protein